MTYIFSQEEKDQIKQYVNDKKSGIDDLGFAKAYEYISDTLESKTNADGTALIDDSGIHAVQLWFAGAAQSNANEGIFSTLLREYTRQQGALRGLTINDEQLDAASDAVAISALERIISEGKLPTIDVIAKLDATAIGLTLFSVLGDSDPAVANNSAWAGSVLFSMLASDQTGRLLGAQGDNTFDTLSDFRDLVFAVESLDFAYNKAIFGDWDFFEDLSIGFGTMDLSNNILDITSSNNLLLDMTEGTDGHDSLKFIVDHGRYALIDDLAGIVGLSLGASNEANFVANSARVGWGEK